MGILLAAMVSSIAAWANLSAEEITRGYDPTIREERLRESWSLLGCRIEELTLWGKDPLSGESRAVAVTLYRGDSENRAAVLILPPTGGVNILDQGYANHLCYHGITAAVITGWEHQNETSLDPSMHRRGAIRSVAATRHVMEFLLNRGYRSLGALGTSVGAITGALAFGLDDRIAATALIVGSSRFADVIAESDEQGAARLRQERQAAYGWSPEEYRNALREAVGIEPGNFLGRKGGRKALVVTATADTTVPTPYQRELAQKIGADVHLEIPGNHLEGIKRAFLWRRHDIVGFFRKALAQ